MSRKISAIETRGGPRYACPFEVQWCEPAVDCMKISHELLAERPTLPQELPWGMEELESDDQGVYYRRTLPVTGDWELAKAVGI